MRLLTTLPAHTKGADESYFWPLGRGVGVGLGLGLGLGDGSGLGLGTGVGEPVGLGLGLAPGLGLGTGVGIGLGLGDGVWAGIGLSAGVLGIAGFADGVAGVVVAGRDRLEPRRVFLRGVAGEVTSAGDGPTSAGLATSAPVAPCVLCCERLFRLAVVDDGINEHVLVEPAIGVKISRSPLFRPLNEITVGGVVAPSPICSATAVYPAVVDATMRPVFPSGVENWFPLMVNVVSPVSPNSSHLKVPA
jgi:hypothetical protein